MDLADLEIQYEAMQQENEIKLVGNKALLEKLSALHATLAGSDDEIERLHLMLASAHREMNRVDGLMEQTNLLLSHMTQFKALPRLPLPDWDAELRELEYAHRTARSGSALHEKLSYAELRERMARTQLETQELRRKICARDNTASIAAVSPPKLAVEPSIIEAAQELHHHHHYYYISQREAIPTPTGNRQYQLKAVNGLFTPPDSVGKENYRRQPRRRRRRNSCPMTECSITSNKTETGTISSDWDEDYGTPKLVKKATSAGTLAHSVSPKRHISPVPFNLPRKGSFPAKFLGRAASRDSNLMISPRQSYPCLSSRRISSTTVASPTTDFASAAPRLTPAGNQKASIVLRRATIMKNDSMQRTDVFQVPSTPPRRVASMASHLWRSFGSTTPTPQPELKATTQSKEKQSLEHCAALEVVTSSVDEAMLQEALAG